MQGGTLLRIEGERFPSTVTVLVGGVRSPDVQVVNETLILAETPPGEPGPARVTVMGGYSEGNVRTSIWSGWFHYEHPPGVPPDARFDGPLEIDLAGYAGEASGRAFADLDGDGDQDLVIVRYGGLRRLSIRLVHRTGPEEFEDDGTPDLVVDLPARGDVDAVRVGDVTGNDLADLLVVRASHEGSLLVVEQGPRGELGSVRFLGDSRSRVGRVFSIEALVDADGDGRREILVENDDHHLLRIDAEGRILEVVDGVRRRGRRVEVLDLARDGRPDLVMAGGSENDSGWSRLWYLLGSDEGFGPARLAYDPGRHAGWSVHDLTLVDLDGDGPDDLLTVGREQEDRWDPGTTRQHVQVFPDAADGVFQPVTQDLGPFDWWETTPLRIRMRPADVDQDGADETLVSQRVGEIGDRSWRLRWIDPGPDAIRVEALDPTWAVPFGALGCVTDDVDDDGLLDLLTARGQSQARHTGTVTWVSGRGDGTFATVSGRPKGGSWAPSEVEVRDVDGEGTLDLVAGGLVAYGGPAGLPWRVLPGMPDWMAGNHVVDLDGDGTVELVGHEANGYLEMGSLADAEPEQVPFPDSSRVWAGDVDGDGRDEVLFWTRGHTILQAWPDPRTTPESSVWTVAPIGDDEELLDLVLIPAGGTQPLLVLLAHRSATDEAVVRILRPARRGYRETEVVLDGFATSLDWARDGSGVPELVTCPDEMTVIRLGAGGPVVRTVPGSPRGSRAQLVDANGDGYLDIFVAGSLGLRDVGGRVFSRRAYLQSTANVAWDGLMVLTPSRVEDVDLDGRLELVGPFAHHEREW